LTPTNYKPNYKLTFFIVLFFVFSGFGYSSQSIADEFVFKTQESQKVLFINHGTDSLVKRIQMIDSAEKLIELETFIFFIPSNTLPQHESGVELILDRLAKKAADGVTVRLLVDNRMHQKGEYKQRLIDFAAESGVELRFFNSAPYPKNRRNHRKALCIDSGTKGCMLGGRNIAEEYWGLNRKFNHLDRDLIVYDEASRFVHESFAAFWQAPNTQIVLKSRPQKAYKNRIKSHNFWTKLLEQQQSQTNPAFASFETKCSRLEIHSDRPLKNKEVTNALVKAVEEAKEQIYIESPVWILSKTKIGEALAKALNKNVEIHGAFLGGDADNFAVSIFNVDDAKRFTGLGLKSYAKDYMKLDEEEYKFIFPEFEKVPFLTHSKMFLIDPRSAHPLIIVGSYNLDPRSERYNSEIMVFCKADQAATQKMQESFMFWKKAAKQVDCKGCGYFASSGNKVPMRQKLLKPFLRPFKFLY
jgi:cardiolipin synthase C